MDYDKSTTVINKEDGTITYMVESLPQGFTTTLRGEEKYKYIYKGLFEGLIEKDEQGNIIPALAKAYVVSDDGLQYTFTLRDDIHYSNGKRITAEDFIEFFESVLHSSQEDRLSEGLRMVYGVLEYHKGNTSFQGVAIKAASEDTLVFRLNYKSETFLEALSSVEYYLRPVEEIGDLTENYSSISYTGAFYVDTIEDNSILLKRNPYYYIEANSLSSEILLKVALGGEEALTAFKLNLCDIFENPPLNQIGYLEGRGKIVKSFGGSTYGIQFNMDKTDIPFRKSVERGLHAAFTLFSLEGLEFSQYSIDGAFYNDFRSNGESVFTGGDHETYTAQEDGDRMVLISKGYLKSSTMEDKKNIFILSLDTERCRKIGSFVEESLEELLNIQVNVSYVTLNKLAEERRRGEYSMFLYPLEAADEEAFYLSYSSSESPFFLKDEAYADMVKKYHLSAPEDRAVIMAFIKAYMEDNVIFVPLFYDMNIICKNSDIQGVEIDSEGNIILKKLNKIIDKNQKLEKESPIGSIYTQ